MPIYEFQCVVCDKRGEDFFSRTMEESDFTDVQCSECGGAVRKLVSRFKPIDSAVLSSDISKPMTDIERGMALKQKSYLEKNWKHFKKGGLATLHQGKYRDKSLDPDLKHAENMA